MLHEYFLFLNLLFFLGIGLDIILIQHKNNFIEYFKASFTNTITSLLVTILIIKFKVFFNQNNLHELLIFIVIISLTFLINEILLLILKCYDFNLFNSLNLTSYIVPLIIYKENLNLISSIIKAAYLLLGFFVFSVIFYFIKKHTMKQLNTKNNFEEFCCNVIIIAMVSISFSIFYKVV